MTTIERIFDLARKGVDIQLITDLLRSEGVPDTDIRAGYDEIAHHSSTEVVRGQYYIRLDRP